MTSWCKKKVLYQHGDLGTYIRTILFISTQNGTIQKNEVLLSIKTFVTLYATTSFRPTQIALNHLFDMQVIIKLIRYQIYSYLFLYQIKYFKII